MRKALFIGGTGTISTAVSRLVATDPEWQLYVLNRGRRSQVLPDNVQAIQADINNEDEVNDKLKGMTFDCVCDFIGFRRADVERDFRLFGGRTRQYMYISSASAYQKPSTSYLVDEGTTLANPYWQYSRDKIDCEDFLMQQYRTSGFPVTIVRPSHTYDERKLPLGVHGAKGSWQIARRMLAGKPVIIHGDGTSLWTMTHNSDFARGFVGLMGNPHAIGECFQIVSDETLNWNQIYRCIAEALGVELKAVHVASEFLDAVSPYDFRGGLLGDKANSVVFSTAKLRRAVPTFHCNVRFEQGIRQTVDYILAHPECQVVDEEFDAWCDRVIDALQRCAAELQAK